jgi:cobalt-zinc-cadmium efflux system outer membrane protein
MASAKEIWTLERSIEQVIKTSPYIFAADAEIDARKGALSQAGAWPNPSMELGGSQKIGLDSGRGGNDFTEISISQPIPLGRLSHQRQQAKDKLQVAKQERFYQQLLQEHKIAKYFHKLQLAEANVKLAKEQLKFATRYQKSQNKKDPLIRYVSELDQKRLDIIVEISKQEVASAEGQYSEALSNFREFLKLPQDQSVAVATLKTAQLPKKLQELLNMQNTAHAAITAAKYNKNAADASVLVAKSQRFPDPSIKLYQEKDFLNGREQSSDGIMLNFTIPIWDFNNGNISEARARSSKAQYELQALSHKLEAKLRQTYLHLGHLIEQAEHYRTKILEPAKEIFTLNMKSFATGEVKILSLVDANNTYFEVRNRYLELLYKSWVETADLRLAAGLSLQTNNMPITNSGGEL